MSRSLFTLKNTPPPKNIKLEISKTTIFALCCHFNVNSKEQHFNAVLQRKIILIKKNYNIFFIINLNKIHGSVFVV